LFSLLHRPPGCNYLDLRLEEIEQLPIQQLLQWLELLREARDATIRAWEDASPKKETLKPNT